MWFNLILTKCLVVWLFPKFVCTYRKQTQHIPSNMLKLHYFHKSARVNYVYTVPVLHDYILK